MKEFSGKVALVTGGSSGIGAATARRLGAGGAEIAVHYNKGKAAAEAVVADIVGAGGAAFAVGGDVGEPSAVEAFVGEAAARRGKLDILVNCAGILEFALFGEIDPASFERQFRINTLGVLLTMQAAAKRFPASGGRIVNVSTNLVKRQIDGCVAYVATKAAVDALTEGFAKELGKTNVTVNAVAPGATMTPMTAWLSEEMKAGIAGQTPLGRIGQPEDVADAIAYLASDAARFVTGRTLIVDGGLA